MARVFIALGSNIGDREAFIESALRDLEAAAGIDVVTVSPLIETAPVGGPAGQQTYLNAAAELATALNPAALLQRCHAVEASLGRRRTMHWGPRCIDLDILLYDGSVLRSPDLIIPHPRMLDRAFVLEPLAAIAPNVRHPVTNRTIQEHWAQCVVGGQTCR